MTRSFACFLPLLAAMSGCASVPDPRPGLPNSLTLQINNDATGTLVLRSVALNTYTTPRCDGESQAIKKLRMSSEETLTTVPLRPGLPFTFAVTTSNAALGRGASWGCSVTATFTPQYGKVYQAVMETQGDNASCKVKILDRENRIVPSTAPEFSCSRTQSGMVRNGQGYNHKNTVTVPIYIGR